MSGHSKWAGIKHRKGAVDAKRGKIFTRHAKLIEIAAREGGGGDLESNPRLRTAIDNAKANNVPNANIDRAIKKGTGELKGEMQTESVRYEAYGPGGSAYIIECLTENKNRSHSNVKSILNKKNGRVAAGGSVAWMFEEKGVVIADVAGNERDAAELAAIDSGAEDLSYEESHLHVTTSREKWPKVRDALVSIGCSILEAGLKLIPKQTIPIEDQETAQAVLDLIRALEEDDDVSDVHTNANLSEELARSIA